MGTGDISTANATNRIRAQRLETYPICAGSHENGA